ncbi:uncharacterized protein [Misgurnus anguillicaudatus]|uniref:uncharacterized protein n=1 Tax=Misgurnus anguillicaudatus TaxID=75329 RepID=UPI003CCFCE27
MSPIQLEMFQKKLHTILATVAYFIILLNLVNSIGDVNLYAHENQTINCNEKAVLQCNISTSSGAEQFNLKKTNWKKHEEKHFECDPTFNSTSPEFKCDYTKKALTLTILHPKPANMGKYYCTIQTDSGHDSKAINLSMKGECTGDFTWKAGSDQFQCSFNGIYPEGTIYWFHSDNNVTSYSTLTNLTNSDGTFNITSVLRPKDSMDRYNCSLWLLKNGQYLKNQEIQLSNLVRSSFLSRANGQHCSSWTILLVGLMLSLRNFL